MTFRPRQICALVFVISFLGILGSYKLGFQTWPPTGFDVEQNRGTLFYEDDLKRCLAQKARDLVGLPSGWQGCQSFFAQYQALAPFNWRSNLMGGSILLAILSFGGTAFFMQFEEPLPRIIRGRSLLQGRRGLRSFAKASKSECRLSGQGLDFLPDIPISLDRETRHWLIWGSVGGGKTQTMLRLILGAIERGDGVMVLDIKGDMMAGLPGRPLLLAPHDARSLVWDVAADCRTKQDARELAARFIPQSHDPMWSEASREIFAACLHSLQVTNPGHWTWRDLHAAVTMDAEALRELAREHYPDASRLLAQPESKTAQSILINFQSHMNVVSALADAWGHDQAERFSISQWLHDREAFRPVILQRDARYPELSNAWIGGLVGLMGSAVGSPSLRESRTRRIWLFADEFAQLPKIEQFPNILDLGRAKGVIAVLGVQDIAQLRKTYGKDLADAWMGMIGTQIITRINPGPGAEEAARMVGMQEIERKIRSVTHGGKGRSVSYNPQRQTRPVVTASELSTRLGPTRKGIRVLVLGPGDDAYELEIPYTTLRDRRQSVVPAGWTSSQPTKPNRWATARPTAERDEPTARLSPDTAARIRDLAEHR